MTAGNGADAADVVDEPLLHASSSAVVSPSMLCTLADAARCLIAGAAALRMETESTSSSQSLSLDTNGGSSAIVPIVVVVVVDEHDEEVP